MERMCVEQVGTKLSLQPCIALAKDGSERCGAHDRNRRVSDEDYADAIQRTWLPMMPQERVAAWWRRRGVEA